MSLNKIFFSYYTHFFLQDYDKLIDDAIKNNDEAISKFDVKVVILKPDVDGGSIGITLAGGADYEIKEITVTQMKFCQHHIYLSSFLVDSQN